MSLSSSCDSNSNLIFNQLQFATSIKNLNLYNPNDLEWTNQIEISCNRTFLARADLVGTLQSNQPCAFLSLYKPTSTDRLTSQPHSRLKTQVRKTGTLAFFREHNGEKGPSVLSCPNGDCLRKFHVLLSSTVHNQIRN